MQELSRRPTTHCQILATMFDYVPLNILRHDRFQRFDMDEIRVRETTVSIPPWHGTTRTREVDEQDEEEEERTCDHHDEEISTETCTELLITKLFWCNDSPNCESTFVSKNTARNHLVRAYQNWTDVHTNAAYTTE